MAFDPYTNYLDIWNIVNMEIVGATWLTIAIGLSLIGYFGMKYMIPFQVIILFTVLFIGIVGIVAGNIGLWAFVVMIVFGFFYWVMARMVRRN